MATQTGDIDNIDMQDFSKWMSTLDAKILKSSSLDELVSAYKDGFQAPTLMDRVKFCAEEFSGFFSIVVGDYKTTLAAVYADTRYQAGAMLVSKFG